MLNGMRINLNKEGWILMNNNIMVKKLALILLAAMALTGCISGSENREYLGDGVHHIYTDPDTGVMYLEYSGDGRAITPMYNADGTLKVKEKSDGSDK